ncbi:unnamed protein product [Candidula unifasciata]|uniref:J domain-containing protein n=1 Tax=Candidula unifasciata TaxID=100452 RepID=A0A8S4A3D0_9EUPU|nr:unnamed protein product [Candidula unifasciata]
MPGTGLDAFDEPQVREVRPHMATGLILAGLGLAAVGLAGRFALRAGKLAQTTLNQKFGELPSGSFSKYYRGGFEAKMSRREAGLILGVSPSASKIKIKEAHKRIMLLNHPDKGGSPYIAAKINEAKDLFEKSRPGTS